MTGNEEGIKIPPVTRQLRIDIGQEKGPGDTMESVAGLTAAVIGFAGKVAAKVYEKGSEWQRHREEPGNASRPARTMRFMTPYAEAIYGDIASLSGITVVCPVDSCSDTSIMGPVAPVSEGWTNNILGFTTVVLGNITGPVVDLSRRVMERGTAALKTLSSSN